jgi:late competence protein required for DNA uptake (superfamily II DNA/RNA helicase)
MKFTVNNKFGIGQILEVNEGIATIYFEDEDVTKELVLKFIPTFGTIEEAETALNPESAEDVIAKIKSDEMDRKDQIKSMHNLEEMNIEMSKRLMKTL